MLSFERTSLWGRTLAEAPDDPWKQERGALRNAFMQFRETVEPLAAEIARSMPSFTDHSVAHIDALWDMASILCGDDYPINAAEAFVLGGAFLLHDLGMGLVAYPDGLDEVKRDPSWDDMLMSAKERLAQESPGVTAAAIEHAATAETMAAILRLRHARRAERLISEFFPMVRGGGFYLLQDANLRQAFGPLIGKIAHSHWWNVEDLAREFGQVRGSLPEHPGEWSVDPLKVACTLRIADAAHIDNRRAPTYLHAFRRPTGPSRDHWDFQQRLMRPRRVDDRLEYTSAGHFRSDEAESWWLAYETIGVIDHELRKVDALCADLGRPRFAARSVAGADSPTRLASYLPTEHWHPIDASLHVSHVPSLVATLGGSALYGPAKLAALRELVANAADATRARQLVWGGGDAVVTVELGREHDEYWLTVRDQGIGMDSATMVDALTDFGRSYWQSQSMLSSYPKLLSQGFRPRGRYGIGFFAVFMVADYVTVASLKYYDSPNNTHVLEFRSGLQTRPLLRKAREDELIRLGGTVVRARLTAHPTKEDAGLLDGYAKLGKTSDEELGGLLVRLTAQLCALADVDIEVLGPGLPEKQIAVRANDWRFIPSCDLFDRVYFDEPADTSSESYILARKAFGQYSTEVLDSSGEVIGKAMIGPGPSPSDWSIWRSAFYARALVYVGGMYASNISGITGVLVGRPTKADRSEAAISADMDSLERWGESQAPLLQAYSGDCEDKNAIAEVARSIGVSASFLPAGLTNAGELPLEELEGWARSKTSITLVSSSGLFVDSNAKGSVRCLSFMTGNEVVLSDDYLLLEAYSGWALPQEVTAHPRHAPAIEMLRERRDPASRWVLAGSSMYNKLYILRSISASWSCKIADLLDRSSVHEWSPSKDERLILCDSEGRPCARQSAMQITR